MTVTLREVTQEDLPIFFEHQLDAEATRMAAFPSRDRDAFMAHWARIMSNETGILNTILADDTVAGNVVYWEAAGEPNIGYWLGKTHWGKGIASAALAQFLTKIEARPRPPSLILFSLDLWRRCQEFHSTSSLAA